MASNIVSEIFSRWDSEYGFMPFSTQPGPCNKRVSVHSGGKPQWVVTWCEQSEKGHTLYDLIRSAPPFSGFMNQLGKKLIRRKSGGGPAVGVINLFVTLLDRHTGIPCMVPLNFPLCMIPNLSRVELYTKEKPAIMLKSPHGDFVDFLMVDSNLFMKENVILAMDKKVCSLAIPMKRRTPLRESLEEFFSFGDGSTKFSLYYKPHFFSLTLNTVELLHDLMRATGAVHQTCEVVFVATNPPLFPLRAPIEIPKQDGPLMGPISMREDGTVVPQRELNEMRYNIIEVINEEYGEEKMERSDKLACNICLTGEIDTVIIPCGHPICTDCMASCFKTIRRCPVCKGPMHTYQRLFL